MKNNLIVGNFGHPDFAAVLDAAGRCAGGTAPCPLASIVELLPAVTASDALHLTDPAYVVVPYHLEAPNHFFTAFCRPTPAARVRPPGLHGAGRGLCPS
eukprot:7874046-Lingulodinium_polyedra.AAC.1